MTVFHMAGAVALTTLLSSTSALAQITSDAIPAEFPPASYTGTQYVDSQGCAFIRAGISGAVTWVPRVSRTREQLCGFQPTFATAPEPEPMAAPVPVEVPQIVEADPVLAPEPAVETPVVAEAPAVTPTPEPAQAPIATASATPAPAPAPAVSPVVQPLPAAPAPEVAEPAPRQMTFAEACEGRFGIQTGMISASTGEPVDCGPASAIAGATPAVTADPAPAAVTAEPRRVTLAEICAEIVSTGATFINQATGQPVDCSSLGNAQPVQLADLWDGRVPASNPIGTTATVSPPPGYEQVWDDGRVNPDRGVSDAVSGQAVTPTAVVSTRTVPQTATTPRPAALSHRYVQVGTFGVPENASQTAARLRSLGLPVGMMNITRNGQVLQVVAAGPFSDASELQAALQAARNAGFADAFTRN